jgi:hypothetical protein
MTRTIFILAGGNDQKSEDYGRHLSEEVAKHADNPKVLSCFFSAPPGTWEQKAQDWKGWFSDHFTQPFTYDYAQYATLLEQIDAADVIYFHGGDTRLLFEHLPETHKLKKHFTGKVIIGSSAGANVLSTHYWSSTRGGFCEGRAVLGVNVMVHYHAADASGHKRTPEDWKREEAEFQERLGDRAVTPLPEGQFVVVEKESKPRIVIVNENDEIIAHKERGTLIQKDIYRVSALWVKNFKGDILLAQRKFTKSHDPGKWGPAVAGTVDEGETYEQNIIKEAEEEIGLKNIRPTLGPKIRMTGEYNYFDQWYTLNLSLKTPSGPAIRSAPKKLFPDYRKVLFGCCPAGCHPR